MPRDSIQPFSRRAWEEKRRRWAMEQEQKRRGRMRIVITSYSIHYTKLYDKPGFRIGPYFHLSIVIFQVGVIGICSEVAPFSQYRIPQEAIVRLVAVAKDDRIIHFPVV